MNKSNCKICNDTTTEFFDIENRKLFYCPSCKFISLDKRFHLSLNEEKERYLKHDNSFQNKEYIKYFEGIIEDNLLGLLKKGLKVLDFGSGRFPVFSSVLNAKGIEVRIFDKLFYSDNSYLEEKYNLITIIETFEHLKFPLSVLKRLITLLLPEGFLFIVTRFHNNNLHDFIDWWYLKDQTHVSFFHNDTIVFICNKLGLKIKKIDDRSCMLRLNS